MIAGVKKVSNARIGDSINEKNSPTAEAFPGFKEAKPMVFCGMFPAGESGKDGQVMEIHNPSPRAMPPSGSGGKARDCEGNGQALPKRCFS